MNIRNEPNRDILWTHIQALYEEEKASLLTRQTRLTNAHMILKSYDKVSRHKLIESNCMMFLVPIQYLT